MSERTATGATQDVRGLLRTLALDLRWTWSHRGDALWRALDAELWDRTGNPFVVLAELDDTTIALRASDPDVRRRIDELLEEQARYRAERTWWSSRSRGALGGVAYFSMEFGLAEALPIYAGGLGVLAGDVLKGASDLGLPVYGIGLLYRQGFFRQRIDAEGRQLAVNAAIDPARLPLAPARLPNGEELRVAIHLPGRQVTLRVWQAQVGRVALFLLDSNDPRNAPADLGITNVLYCGDPEQRLLQEIALGVGGWRAVEALGLPVQICHLNEGHAALAAVERARQVMRRHALGFGEALWATRAANVFTTHTPVAAGFDVFPRELVLRYGRTYAESMGVGEDELMQLGSEPGSAQDRFNMAFLAARCSATIQAVSRRHEDVSRRIFAPLFPRWPLHEIPVTHITNAIHVPSWDSPESDSLWEIRCGRGRWCGDVAPHAGTMASVTDEQLLTMRLAARQRLVRFARRRLARQLGQRGADDSEIAAAAMVLDPNALTLGFARRFTGYKRPNLPMHDPERLVRLLGDERRPVQLILAGKAHPDDAPGQRMIEDWIRLAGDPRVRARLVFLEDYDLAVAAELVQGVDVWINTPREPWEACGTSGMKVLVNGGLNLSILDGWWAEAFDAEVGWGIASAGDEADARRLLEILENEIVPTFFSHDTDGVPRGWLARVRASMSRLTPRFSSNRMLEEYAARLYEPSADAFRRRVADDCGEARRLAAWAARLEHDWHALRLGTTCWTPGADGWRFTVEVHLGELTTDDVDVSLYSDHFDGGVPLCLPLRHAGPVVGASNVHRYEAAGIRTCSPGDYTPRVVPHLPDAVRRAELPLVRWP